MSDPPLVFSLRGRTPEHSFPASPSRGGGGVGVARVLACQKDISLCALCPENPGRAQGRTPVATVNRQGPRPPPQARPPRRVLLQEPPRTRPPSLHVVSIPERVRDSLCCSDLTPSNVKPAQSRSHVMLTFLQVTSYCWKGERIWKTRS